MQVGSKVKVVFRDISGTPIQQYLTAHNTLTSFPRADEPQVDATGEILEHYEIGDKYKVRFDRRKEYGLVELSSGVYHSTDLRLL